MSSFDSAEDATSRRAWCSCWIDWKRCRDGRWVTIIRRFQSMIPFARIIIRFLLRLLFRVELRGSAKLAGKTLIVANHQSFIDGLLLGAFLPFAPTYLVHAQIASKWNFKILLSFIDYLVIASTSPLA